MLYSRIILILSLLALTIQLSSGQDAPDRTALERQFKETDRNSDGVLTLDELGSEVPFSQIDGDNDVQLTLEEIITFVQTIQRGLILPGIDKLDLSKPTSSVDQRISNRTFPSVFMAWNPATNLNNEHHMVTIARHDLVFSGPNMTGLRWNRKPTGLADGFTSESTPHAQKYRAALNALNPNLILLAEIRYRDAMDGYLPKDHTWWKRDQDGERIIGWEEGPAYELDFGNPQLRSNVAKKAKSAVADGVFDGIMLDWWIDDKDRLTLLKEIRKAIGPDKLILVNANDRQTPESAPYVNGYFMECWRSKGREDWDRIAKTLRFAESNLREPRINCLETWYLKSRDDEHRMRATTCLVLTQSNGYCLFSDPNDLPSPDHLHNWYPFWNRRLGQPAAPGSIADDGSSMRDFDHGTAVYNPLDNPIKTVRFDEPRRSLQTGQVAIEHQVKPLDGDLFLKTDAPEETPATQQQLRKTPVPPTIRRGLTGWHLRERGAHLTEDFNAEEVDQKRWRIWHSNPDHVSFACNRGRFSIEGTGQIGHNGLWQLTARRFKDVTLVARMNISSNVPKSHDLCLHLCGGDMPASPDHWVEICMRDAESNEVEFHIASAAEKNYFTQSQKKVILPRIGESGFLARLSLNGSTNLCTAEVREANGNWRPIIDPTPLLVRTTHCEVKLRGDGNKQQDSATSTGWFDDVRIYPNAASHPILVHLTGPNGKSIFQRDGETWPPKIQVEGSAPISLEELVVGLWTLDGKHLVSQVQSSNFAYYMLPVVHDSWDVFPVGAIIRLSYRDKSLGEVTIPVDGLTGVYPDDMYELIVE